MRSTPSRVSETGAGTGTRARSLRTPGHAAVRRTISDGGIAKLLTSQVVQAKLVVGAARDQYESEADRVADAVLRPAPGGAFAPPRISRLSPPPIQRCSACAEERLQRKAAGDPLFLQRKCAACEADALLQRRSRHPGAVAPSIEQSIATARGNGHPLSTGLRTRFESRFGADLSGIRVHTDPGAAQLADAVGAHAFTTGRDIFFAAGRYQPQSTEGQRLLAHEVTHTIQQQGATPALLQREESDAALTEEVDLGWSDKAAIELFSGSSYAMGGTVHDMVEATATGFIKQVKIDAKKKGPEVWKKIKDSLTVTGVGLFVLHYWWGLIKGIFSPITGLIDLAKLAIQLSTLPAQIMATAWTKRHELAEDASSMSRGMSALATRVSEFLGGLKSHPIETVKSLAGWFSSLKNDAIKGAEHGGRSAGHDLMSQLDKPLPELGEIAGEVVGTVLINIVLLVFTEGIGNAISQIATRVGELGSFLGKFGKAAEMLGAVVSKIGSVLDVVGGWVTKAEAAIAKVAETVLKPIGPVLEEFGKLVSGLRNFLRTLLGVSEEAALSTTEQAAGGAARVLESKAPPPVPKSVTPKPTVKAPPVAAADSATGEAAAKATTKAVPKPPPTDPVTPPVVEPKSVPPATKPGSGRLFEGLSEDTEQMFAKRPGLKKVLEDHPDAAKLLKVCNSPCVFPEFMTDQEVAERLVRLERMKAAAKSAGVPFEEGPLKKLLNRAKTVEEVDQILDTVEQRAGTKIKGVFSGQEEPVPAQQLPPPKVKKPTKGPLDPNSPPKQFEDMPEQLPEGYEDLPDKHGDAKRPSPGGKQEKPKAFAGKEAHKLAEILQNDPQVLARLRAETGAGDIFSRKLPEGMEPEFKINHPDFPGRKPSIDRLWRKGDTIFEIKPDTMPAAKGLTQARQYADWMEKYGELPPGGGKWKVEVITYDQKRLITFLRKIGSLAP